MRKIIIDYNKNMVENCRGGSSTHPKISEIIATNRGQVEDLPLQGDSEFRVLSKKNGSFLVEILVSTVIIAMMMTTLFGFVSFAGDVWRKSSSSVNLANEGNMLMDTIEHEMNLALTVSTPASGASGSVINYTKRISDYNGNHANDGLFCINHDGSTKTVSLSIQFPPSGWSIGTSDGIDVANTYYYNYDISNHVSSLLFNRKSARLIEVTATLAVNSTDRKINDELKLKRNVILSGI